MIGKKHKLGDKFPTEHERAPKVSPEVTPVFKGGNLERKVKQKS